MSSSPAQPGDTHSPDALAKPTHTVCLNCGTALHGPFCQQCGQHDFDFSRSFRHVSLEALEDFFHFDAKLFRNVVTLLFRPGVLTSQYNAGKRASQMPPFRLYLFVSVLFFFTSFLSGNMVIRWASPTATEHVSAASHSGTTALSRPEPAAVRVPKPALNRTPDSGFGRFIKERLEFYSNHQEEAATELAHAFPKILLLCLPIFAFLTNRLFRHGGQLYLQHLIGAVHFHTFIFLWKMVGDGWVMLLAAASPAVAAAAEIGVRAWFVAYPLLMLRHLYGESWPRTIFKAGLLCLLYYVAGLLCFLGALFLLAG